MMYYKKLDLEFSEVAKKTLEYAKINKDKITSFWTNVNYDDFVKHVPEITTMFESMNLHPKRVAFVVAVKDVGIHRDATTSTARINLPILNCEHSLTKFWKTMVEPTLLQLPNGVPYMFLDEIDCNLVEQVCLDKPTVLRITEPHSVHVGNKVPRISLTIEFFEDLTYLLE